MREDADVFNADALAADNADVSAADNANVLAAVTADVLAADTRDVLAADTRDVLAADTTDVLAADNKEAPVPVSENIAFCVDETQNFEFCADETSAERSWPGTKVCFDCVYHQIGAIWNSRPAAAAGSGSDVSRCRSGPPFHPCRGPG